MLVVLICNLNLHMSMCNSSFHNYASQTCLAGTLIDGLVVFQRFIDLNTTSNYHTFFCRIEDNGSGQTAENVKVEFYVSLTLRGSRW